MATHREAQITIMVIPASRGQWVRCGSGPVENLPELLVLQAKIGVLFSPQGPRDTWRAAMASQLLQDNKTLFALSPHWCTGEHFAGGIANSAQPVPV